MSLKIILHHWVNLPLLLSLTLPVIGQCKPLFIGDSLTYELAMSYKKNAPVDAKFLESTGLQSKQILNWQDYTQNIDFSLYDTVYIVLGTNDLISKADIPEYQQKANRFIQTIKKQNEQIVWLLPPTLSNTEKNNLLSNTRTAIRQAAHKNKIKTMDTRVSLGYQYSEFINGVKVRTSDGIHITKNGADLIISELVKVK
ncbi:GDSL-type esterase/lipase family protein [Providencia rettgeri]